MRIAIQGEKGSFHHQAAKKWFHEDISILACNSFHSTFASIESGKADTILVAIENSIYGAINEVHDLLELYRYPIVGEVYLRIRHQLITLPGARPSDIKQIFSHPVALAQCEVFISEHFPNAKRIEYEDTAASVSYIQANKLIENAAIASKVAAEDHNLPILMSDIEDNPANFTRFLVLQPDGEPPIGANKTSLIITTNHAPGALAHALSLFARKDINLVRLQSRPIIGEAWRYRFYIDVEAAGEPLHEILAEIRKTGALTTVLGEYVTGRTY